MTKPQPDLSENPFLPVEKVLSKLKSPGKKDWERKAEIAAKKTTHQSLKQKENL